MFVGMICITCKPIVEKRLKDENPIKKPDVEYSDGSDSVEAE